jgi:hypothetical protein
MKEEEQELEFYSKQGIISDPKEYFYILEQQPFSVDELCKNIRSFVLNDFLYNMHCFQIPEYYQGDMNIRSIDKKLENIEQRTNNQELGELNCSRSVGNCRDISLFICASLRHRAIPSRVRSGFATFFNPIKKFDHWICEYWSFEKKCWQRIDPWMYQINESINLLPKEFSDGFSVLNLDPLSLDSIFFLTGAEAWQKCRKNIDSFNNYGTYKEGLDGEWFVRDNMIRDLFCLNKIETLPWDCWGIMGKQNSLIEETEYLLLDEVASTLLSDNISFKKLDDFFLRLDGNEIFDCLK